MKSFFLLGAVVLAAACSKSSTPEPEPGTHDVAANSVCVEIANACHEHAGHSAKTKECHDMGHSKETTEEQCQARRTECLDECKMAAQESGADDQPEGVDHEHTEGTPEHQH